MEHSCVQLNDLSDEILLIILNKLEKYHVLYSLTGVNQRLTKVAHDFIFTNSMTLFQYQSHKFISRLSNAVFDRLCSYVLPQIQYKINWLDIEVSSMECVLVSGNYPNLFGLGIDNIETDNDLNIFEGKIFRLK
ncbi:hypothetical protein I4U23_023361 [Adineta vaga]|nr:hypothetical protein I4U23_023361 [Adineta vaga]